MLLRDFFRNRYLPEHLLNCRRDSLAQIENSLTLFERWLATQGKTATLDCFDRQTLLEFLVFRRENVKPSTVNRDRRNLLCLWRYAASEGLVQPPPKIPMAKCPEAVPHTFHVSDVSALLKACDRMANPLWWRALLLFLYDSGARITASLSVKKSDLKLDERLVMLRGEHSKTGRTQWVAISQETATALAALTLYSEPSDYVWPWRLSHRRIFVAFERLIKHAGIDVPSGKKFHSFRRTHATLTAKIFDLQTASNSLGHSSVAVTRLYVDRAQLPIQRVADALPRP